MHTVKMKIFPFVANNTIQEHGSKQTDIFPNTRKQRNTFVFVIVNLF